MLVVGPEPSHVGSFPLQWAPKIVTDNQCFFDFAICFHLLPIFIASG
jgi:hypothetical protein